MFAHCQATSFLEMAQDIYRKFLRVCVRFTAILHHILKMDNEQFFQSVTMIMTVTKIQTVQKIHSVNRCKDKNSIVMANDAVGRLRLFVS